LTALQDSNRSKFKSVCRKGRQEQTFKKSVSLNGLGLFSGFSVNMSFIPAPIGTGVVFRRVDLAEKPEIAAHIDNLVSTPRCTILGIGDIQIRCVEHLLSTLKAFEIDNVIIEIDGPEIPMGDGSALLFVKVITEAGITKQEKIIDEYLLSTPLYWSEGETHIVALPSEELRFSYTLSYPKHPLLHSQFYSIQLEKERYKEEIAPCRTFSLYEEVVPLVDQGIIKGGSLTNSVVIKGKEILNPEGLRFSDEMVRHKILDLIGDLSLISHSLLAHFIAIKTGHLANCEFAKKIVQYIREEHQS